MAEIAGMVIATDPSQTNHYPGPDDLIGTGDDMVSDLSTGVNALRANVEGSYGYNAFKFQSSGSDLQARMIRPSRHGSQAQSKPHPISWCVKPAKTKRGMLDYLNALLRQI